MLMPAGVLVVLLLGAIAFDLSLLFLRQRQASSLAVDLANDVVTVAFDEPSFRRDGVFRLDPDQADRLVAAWVEQSALAPDVVEVEVRVVGPDAAEVRVVLRVDYVFARSIPGAAEGTTVEASASAIAAL